MLRSRRKQAQKPELFDMSSTKDLLIQLSPSKLQQATTLASYILEVPGSNLGMDNGWAE
jgi:hypothetical protein